MPSKISIDEIISRRKDLSSDKAPVVKAAKSPASWNKDSRSARFVMNSQAPDRYKDIVVTAGIDTTEFERNPVALLFHASRSWPVGSWSNLEKILKGRPPRIEGDVTLLPEGGPVPEIDQTAWMLANGGIKACSIGFSPNWDDAEMILDEEGKWSGGIKWNSSELLECSIVAVGASQSALIKDAGGDWKLARELVEEMLDTYAKTPEGLLVPRAEYEKTYRTVVEKIAADEIAPAPPPVVELNAEPEAIEPAVENKGMDLLTDEVLDAFAGQIKDTDIVVLRDADEMKLVIERDGAPIGELVLPVDLTVAQIKEVQQSICDRANVDPEAPALETLSIEVDTTAIAEATEKVTALDKLLDSVGAKLTKFFGSKAAEPEPVEPPAPPTAEAIETAKAKAAASLERLTSKGLIEA